MKSDDCRRGWLRGGSAAFEEIPRLRRQWVQAFRTPVGERVRLLQINVLALLPGGGVLCSATSLRRF